MAWVAIALLALGACCAQASAESQPGIQVAARQALFDWGTVEGLELLKEKIVTLQIPDVEKVFNLPIVGEFKLQLSNLHVAAFNASSEDARLSIMDGQFALSVNQIEADISFNWHWEKLGMSGTGQGELLLHGGTISLNFTVINAPSPTAATSNQQHPSQSSSQPLRGGAHGGPWARRMHAAHASNPEPDSLVSEAGQAAAGTAGQQAPTQHPHINVVASSAVFDSVELSIKSYASDWLYQAVLTLFNDQIQRAVISGINGALQKDVPGRINDIMDTLPTRLDIKGTPLTASFQVTLFTSTYVMVQGYGEVESEAASSTLQQASAARAASTASAGSHAEHRRHARQLRAASGSGADKAVEMRQQLLPHQAAASSKAVTLAAAAAGAGGSRGVSEPQRCPFEATALPLGAPEIAADPHMVTLFLHHSIINCMAWGLYRGGTLQISIVEGTVPNLHITTDLMAMLIPELPKTYPKQYMRIDVAALAAPQVSFSAAPEGTGTTTLVASYRTVLYVANDTLGNPQIASLAANLTVSGQLAWDSTIITSAKVSHTVESSAMTVPAPQWDQTVAWFIQNYAGLFPLQTLVDKFVHTPVTSLVALINSHTTAYDGWVALSGDVALRQQ
eukprot:CAMPEP_0202865826 /NCGR_PEP_ID=MMETSP1391-20130828/6456_1 /ASSEMBLY_ACC=CAM_ASM_000867 /TAXON_ID=1034604 /ORGANISM="Chlamydomonas leiostraca, Strain SAG 11-49" /LENGTH=620 /DNA_ID=CAMNT_0049545707 /DNA_START=18 /DNA_END=1880 /DNA_ORIENTATION=+